VCDWRGFQPREEIDDLMIVNFPVSSEPDLFSFPEETNLIKEEVSWW
jgi:hypothetical protein